MARPRKRIDFKKAVVKIQDGSSPQESVSIIFGEGSFGFTVSTPRVYERDRGVLDTVSDDEEEPLALDIEARYTYLTGDGEDVELYDALYGIKTASEWVSSDQREGRECDPYSVDIIMEYEPDCVPGGVTNPNERATFKYFRIEEFNPVASDGTISISGNCNIVHPEIERYNT